MRGPSPGATTSSTASFAARLVAWHSRHGRHDLPWQGTRDPYRIWLSEVMLQQTQVNAVIPYYQRFLESFPDLHALAQASLERVLTLWSGLGYYRRAQHLQAAAAIIVRDFGGVFPRDVASIAALPGIGRSTAAAIAAFAFGTRGAILDGNVKRVLARHCGVEGFPGEVGVERRLWQIAEARLPATDIRIYTQAMMDLGATVCTRRGPRCGDCPVAADCRARIEARVHELPAPRPAKTVPHRAVQMLMLEAAGEVLFEKRPATGIWGGLWSLPELALDADVAAACLARYAVAVVAIEALASIEHAFTHYRLTIHPLRVRIAQRALQAQAPGHVWLTPADALGAALPAPVKRLLRNVPGATPTHLAAPRDAKGRMR